jgi:hypothetical protein
MALYLTTRCWKCVIPTELVKLLGNKLRISHLFFNYKIIQKNGCRLSTQVPTLETTGFHHLVIVKISIIIVLP